MKIAFALNDKQPDRDFVSVDLFPVGADHFDGLPICSINVFGKKSVGLKVYDTNISDSADLQEPSDMIAFAETIRMAADIALMIKESGAYEFGAVRDVVEFMEQTAYEHMHLEFSKLKRPEHASNIKQ